MITGFWAQSMKKNSLVQAKLSPTWAAQVLAQLSWAEWALILFPPARPPARQSARTSSEIAGNEQNWLFNIGRSTLVEYKSVLNNLKNGRQPQWKTTSAEDNLSGRQPHWKTTSVEDDLPRRQPQWKMTSVEPSVEDDLIGSKPHWKTTSVEDDLSGRQP